MTEWMVVRRHKAMTLPGHERPAREDVVETGLTRQDAAFVILKMMGARKQDGWSKRLVSYGARVVE